MPVLQPYTHSGKVMAKRIQLVLNQDVSKLGKLGDLVEVAPGYARNYLLPKGLAVFATPAILRKVERIREEQRQRLLEEKQAATERKAAIEAAGTFSISKQVGKEDAIFGTVTEQELADLILERTSQEVDRRGITLPEIRKTGTYKAEVKLHSEVTATVEFEVVPG
jgi:large subunit ribosomal protein L9